MEHPLTTEQQSAFDLVVNSHENVLITGKPGTGKSVLSRAIIEEFKRLKRAFEVGAPTGLAAININGRTLHSIFRLPTSQGVIHPDYNVFTMDTKVRAMIKYHIKHLIIDEISMVRADMIDYIDRLMRDCKGVNLPFGGAQVIWVGDFHQLPPVMRDEEEYELEEFYPSPFAFDAKVFKGNFKVIQLTEVLRQKGDPAFIRLLDDARMGLMTESGLATLNKNVHAVDDRRIKLCGTNNQADAVNKYFLDKIDMDPMTYTAQKSGIWRVVPVEEVLTLKVGCQVMVKKNRADLKPEERTKESRIVNGTFGVVKSMTDKDVVIEVDGEEFTIRRQTWDFKIKRRENGNWQEIVVASYTQVPLALAWACSLHKSQGQTFDKAHIDASKIFAAGQLYVGLSRARTLAGLSFESPLESKMFMVDENVRRFARSLEETTTV